jgi:hypothetical protein
MAVIDSLVLPPHSALPVFIHTPNLFLLRETIHNLYSVINLFAFDINFKHQLKISCLHFTFIYYLLHLG